jgi:hypothetical protein
MAWLKGLCVKGRLSGVPLTVEDAPGLRNVAQFGEARRARRIAVNIAGLPKLVTRVRSEKSWQQQ